MKKQKIVTLTGAIIALICLIIFFNACDAHATTIEEYEKQININIDRMVQMEELKVHLHVTAELLRANSFINDGLDSQLSQKWHDCNNYQLQKAEENKELEMKIETLRKKESAKKFVGNFKITHYCPCRTCNGSWGSKTAIGTIMTPYKTIAVDPTVIPLGSRVEINGSIYIAEDTGGAIKGNRIDLCVSSHSEAYQKGVLYNVPVYILAE